MSDDNNTSNLPPDAPRPPDGGEQIDTPPDHVDSAASPVAKSPETMTLLPSRATLMKAVADNPRLATITPKAKLFVTVSMLLGLGLFIFIISWNFIELNDLRNLSAGRRSLPFIGPGSISVYGLSLSTFLLWLYVQWRFVWARGDVRKMRWMQWTLVESIVILLALVYGLKLFGFKLYKRWDMSHQKTFSLQEPTRRVLRGLNRMANPVSIVLLTQAPKRFQRGRRRDFNTARHYNMLRNLVQEMLMEANLDAPGKLTFEEINIDSQPEKAKQLAANMGMIRLESDWAFGVILLTGRVTKEGNLADTDWVLINVDDMYQSVKAGQGTRSIFIGEDVISAGLRRLDIGHRDVGYYIRGYGEPNLYDLPELTRAAQSANMLVQDEYLSRIDSIPGTVKLVMVIGPTFPIPDADIDKLIEYRKNGGNLLVCLEPDSTRKGSGLNRLLKECNLKAYSSSEIVYAEFRDNYFYKKETRQAMLPNIHVKEPILQGFDFNRDFFLFINAIPVSRLPGKSLNKDVVTVPVIQTLLDDNDSKSRFVTRIWANDKSGEEHPRPDDSELDRPAKTAIPTAMISYRLAENALKTDTRTYTALQRTRRVLAVGDADWITNPSVNSVPSNVLLLHNALKYLAGDVGSLGIEPKTRERYSVPKDKLSDNHLPMLVAIYSVLPAAIIGLLGFVVILGRRRKAQSAAMDDAGRFLDRAGAPSEASHEHDGERP